MKGQIEKRACKNCIHYQMCVETFRKAKQDGDILLIEEKAYFADANGCDFYADKRIYRKQVWISVEDDLPNEGEDLLIWIGSAKPARIRKGITEEERQKMRNGELPNPKNEYWCGSKGYVSIERSEIRKEEDVWGNNLVPYCWELDGGYTLFGQQVKYWMTRPEPPKTKGGAE